jgi:hypothetical protein
VIAVGVILVTFLNIRAQTRLHQNAGGWHNNGAHNYDVIVNIL